MSLCADRLMAWYQNGNPGPFSFLFNAGPSVAGRPHHRERKKRNLFIFCHRILINMAGHRVWWRWRPYQPNNNNKKKRNGEKIYVRGKREEEKKRETGKLHNSTIKTAVLLPFFLLPLLRHIKVSYRDFFFSLLDEFFRSFSCRWGGDSNNSSRCLCPFIMEAEKCKKKATQMDRNETKH